MEYLLHIDWKALFIPQHSLAELMIRGSCIYLSLFFLLRVILKRQMGDVGIGDLLVIVLGSIDI